MRAIRSAVPLVLTLVALGASPGSALALLPTGNLVADGGEGSLFSPTGYQVVSLSPWSRDPSNPTTTRVAYGTPGFPTKDQSAALGGGLTFLAGGPPPAADNGTKNGSIIYETFPLPADAYADINAGIVQITISACLGGYADQGDYTEIDGGAHNYGDDRLPSDIGLPGPGAAERGNQTKLLPRAGTATLPPYASTYTLAVIFRRLSGANTYNDAYADNIEARLSYVGTTPPPANCTTPAAPGAPSGGGSPGGGGGSTPTPQGGASLAGTNTAVPLTRASKRVQLTKHYALLKLHCAARDEACKGHVSLKTQSTTLGSATFRIAVGKSATIKVKLGPKARRRLAHLSKRQLAKLKIKATATIGAQKTTFTLGARH